MALLVPLGLLLGLLSSLRLLSAAFNLEFGISRQYLRLLEFVLRSSEPKIRKVASRRSLAHHAHPDPPEPEAPLEPQPARKRRATPDGPPVFLLDDCELSRDELEPAERFSLDLAGLFVGRSIQSIVDDQVTKRFKAEQLKTWNLLSRTSLRNYQLLSARLGLVWLCGLLVRYGLLLPLRLLFTLTGLAWLFASMSLVGVVPRRWRLRPYWLCSLMAFRMLACGITSRLRFHNRRWRAGMGDVCVANHTSPLDVVVLACDNCYALVGQRHSGLLGWLERLLSRAMNHVWFDRAQLEDRRLVGAKLKQHINGAFNLPVLIFPEGTCINNSAVMMFRKGSFELADTVCPVAMRYDQRFGDPFWNSSSQSYAQYLLGLMSSWAIKCDVWYLEPMRRLPEESAAEFAARVKAEIAKKSGLVDLAWDGQLKRHSTKEVWRHQQQQDFARRLNLV